MADSLSSPGPSRGESVLIVSTVTFVLATIFVVSRLISRFAIVRNHTWDDWFIIAAWFIAFGVTFSIDYGTSKGLGSKDADIKKEWIPALRSSEYAFTILYNPALMATKTSILIFYLRMSQNTQVVLRYASYATLGLVNVSGIVLTFLNAFQCSPPHAAYAAVRDSAKCINIITLYLCQSPVNIICNLAILVLPIPVLTGMRLPQRQKAVLVGTFALGIFVTIVDVIRIYYLQKAADTQTASADRFDTTVDFSWIASTAYMWSAVEVNIGIICACIPTLKPLVKRVLPSMISDRTRSNSAVEKSPLSSDVAPEVNAPSPTTLVDIRAPPTAHSRNGDGEGEMSFLDFLTGPDNGMDRSATVATTRTSATDNTVYFGFVNMKKPKSMLKLKGREAFKYCITVTILFFLWGFSYGLLNTLNGVISGIARHSTAQTLGLSAAYFGAYFFGALTVGQWVLRHAGFKATFITGLCFYGTGTLMFWPSAVLTSFPGFIISNFVVAFGLSILETAANPFLALCGPSQYSEFRLLLAQGVQGVGSVLSQLIAQKVIFKTVRSKGEASLIDVQWTYLGIALFDVILALFFYYMPLPEATDEDLQQQSERQGIYRSQTVFSPRMPLIYTTLGLAVFAQFCYVAAQEGISVWIGPLLNSLATESRTRLTLTTDDFVLVGHVAFAIARFLFGFLSLAVAPRLLLLVALLGALLFSALTMAVRTTGNGVAGFVIMFFFFEGPVWPLIFAIGLRGLGRRTKLGAAMITASASGGGVFPFVMWAVQQVDDRTVQYSYVVNVAIFGASCLFPLYLCLVGSARKQVDPKGTALGLPEHERRGTDATDGTQTPMRRMSRRFSVMFAKIGGTGKTSIDEEPVIEHRESAGNVMPKLSIDQDATPDFVDRDFGADIDAQLNRMQHQDERGRETMSAEDRIWNSWEGDGSVAKRRDIDRLRGGM